MKIPSFVPLVESERKSRERVGFAIEILVWAYLSVVACRILYFGIALPFLEDLSYAEPPVLWAQNYLASVGYDRHSEFAWSSLGIAAAVGAVVGALVGFTGRGLGPWLASLSRIQVNNPEDSIKITNHWSFARKEGFLVLAMTVVTGWVLTKIDVASMFAAEGLQGAGRMVLQISCGIPLVGVEFGGISLFSILRSLLNGLVSLHGTIGGVFGWESLTSFAQVCVPTDAAYYGMALTKLVESIYLAFMATFFAVPVAFLIAFFAARNLTRHSALMRFAYSFSRTYINITRSIEPIIWAILFAVWVGIGPFAGSMALMIHSISSLVKQYSEAIEGVDEGPIEALRATGANRIATAWFAVVPQVMLPYLAFTIYRWDINVRMATIIGLVGGGGIGGLLIQEQGLANWSRVGTIAFLIFVVVWTMDFISAKVREAIQ
jgi:phosphonate transport system permease protein